MIFNMMSSLAYAVAYKFAYINYLHEYFEYLHFPYYDRGALSWALTIFFVIFPSFLIGHIKNASAVFSAFVYVLIYIPTIVTLNLAYSGGNLDLVLAQMTFMVAITMLLLASKFEFASNFKESLKKNYFGELLIATVAGSIVYIILTYGSALEFVALDNVYTHRAANKELGSTGLMAYVINWTSAFVVPVLIAIGITRKKYIYFFVGCMASVVIYMTEGSKGVLLMPIILCFFYLIMVRFGIDNLYKSTIIFLSLVMTFGTAYVMFFGLDAPLTIFIAIILMRVVATGGILNTIYYEFFQSNPKTYLSQYGPINGIFQKYPYDGEPVGYVIGREYVFEGMNVNSNFWASDGLMNAGLVGVLAITIMICFFLVVLNRQSRNSSLSLASLLVLIFFSTAANASFFQALWSGGGLFMLLSFKYLESK